MSLLLLILLFVKVAPVQEPFLTTTPTLSKLHLKTQSRWSTWTGDKHFRSSTVRADKYSFIWELRKVNDNLMSRMTLSRSRVSEVVATYPRDDSFKVDTTTEIDSTLVVLNWLTCMQASRKLCELIKNEVAGIFGPVSPVSSNHVQSVRALPFLFPFSFWNSM